MSIFYKIGRSKSKKKIPSREKIGISLEKELTETPLQEDGVLKGVIKGNKHPISQNQLENL